MLRHLSAVRAGPPEVKRKYYKQDVQYRLCSFWLDRDDKVGPLGVEKCGSKVAPHWPKSLAKGI